LSPDGGSSSSQIGSPWVRHASPVAWAGVLPGLDILAFDISGMVTFTAAPTVLETVAYLTLLAPVLVPVLRSTPSSRAGAAPGASPKSETSSHVPA
jgi:high-affinity iron transporter